MLYTLQYCNNDGVYRMLHVSGIFTYPAMPRSRRGRITGVPLYDHFTMHIITSLMAEVLKFKMRCPCNVCFHSTKGLPRIESASFNVYKYFT